MEFLTIENHSFNLLQTKAKRFMCNLLPKNYQKSAELIVCFHSQILEEMQKVSETGWIIYSKFAMKSVKFLGNFRSRNLWLMNKRGFLCSTNRAWFQASSGHSDSANRPGYVARPIYFSEHKQIYFSLPLVPPMPFLPSSPSLPVTTRLVYSSFQLGA